jgi:hypothetical protein
MHERGDHYTGVNLREALDDARRLGCTVSPIDRTGELSVSHPAWRHHIRLNGRKKSAPRILTVRLLGLMRPEPVPEPPPSPPILVQAFEECAWVVVRGADYWTGTRWDPDPRQALVCWARQEARGYARRLRG